MFNNPDNVRILVAALLLIIMVLFLCASLFYVAYLHQKKILEERQLAEDENYHTEIIKYPKYDLKLWQGPWIDPEQKAQ